MRAPNFLVIGAQKSGTTYLCSYLARHPDVYFSDPKELMFFQRKGLDQKAYKRYLEKHFSNAQLEKYVGEGSTTYLQWPESLNNIKNFLSSELKIIVCLRHPVEKAISFYIHNWRKKRYSGHESILEVGKGSITLSPTETSKYADHIQRWLKAYGKNQVEFLLFDTLVKSNQQFVKQATDFLGISEVECIDTKKINAGFPLEFVNNKLVVAATPKKGQVVPEFTLADLQLLQMSLSEDISRTEQFIEQNLDCWKTLPDICTKTVS